ncbi:proline dehydrogenase family protein [Pseudomonas sp. O64]|uniref:proline dehydrogenase family protein n=1 Tax=Pseudomonas TaxID=286 RepID=UPI000BA04325|nr:MULTISPECIES: proline dehydrogenase family protein [unclassified Pseudomonas]MCV2230073.1 proline dehydrogenase family protein [Pseudomonas sp. AU10]OZO06395.1 proline dehydrogenase [Pseudomonas sp. IB20]UXZ23674.1 proline dehydrogenase family protein [Pseudomonas sp. YeP6b]
MPSKEIYTLACAGLKKLALNQECRDAFNKNSLFFKLFEQAAHRYIIASDAQELNRKLHTLAAKGYQLGVEYVGEENHDPQVVQRFVSEYLSAVQRFADAGLKPQLGFDLSAVGMLISQETAYRNAATILSAAAQHDIPVMISMEHSSAVDKILEVYAELAPAHHNVGMTVQAHLHRTVNDLPRLISYGRKVRLVKGVYNEAHDIALPRGEELDNRYLMLLDDLLAAHVPVSCATQDPNLIKRLFEGGYHSKIEELEMLHGVQPEVLRSAREAGLTCRIAAVYGDSWYLHFLHRLAESPDNVLEALADFYDPSRITFGAGY